MLHVQQMIETHPNAAIGQHRVLAACIEACLDCAQTCTSCADACLSEPDPAKLVDCIRADLDCADLCHAAVSLATRHAEGSTNVLRLLLRTCADACEACARECAKHGGHHDHCRICAETCRHCATECREACDRLGADTH